MSPSAPSPALPAADAITLRLNLQRKEFVLKVHIDLPARGVTALFGPSGCGKTTCLRAVAGLDRLPDSYVAIKGQVWQDDAAQAWRPTYQRGLGYVFQEASLFAHLNVRRNIEYGLRFAKPAQNKTSAQRGLGADQIEAAIELLGLGALTERMPHALSGGERQRLAIARALAIRPQWLLMDEPLAALDAQRKAEVLPYLENLQQALDIPVLYVSHSMDEVARLSQHMVLLQTGKVIAQGGTHEVMSRLDMPLAHGDSAATVVTGTVTAHDADDHVCSMLLTTAVGHTPLQLHWVSARRRHAGEVLRLRVQARDVSLTLQVAQHSSILNTLPVQVQGISEDGPGQVMVALQAQGTALLARVTQRSAQALGLHSGMSLFAQIKGMAVLDG